MAIKKPKKSTPRQQVWDYMRRNRKAFHVGDILMLTQIRKDQLRRYFQALEVAGYIVKLSGNMFANNSYKMIKVTGVVAPIVVSNNHILKDPNTKEELDVKREPIYLRVRKRIKQLHTDGNEIRIRSLADLGGRTTIKKELTKLTDKGVLSVVYGGWGGNIYKARIEELDELLEEETCLST